MKTKNIARRCWNDILIPILVASAWYAGGRAGSSIDYKLLGIGISVVFGLSGCAITLKYWKP